MIMRIKPEIKIEINEFGNKNYYRVVFLEVHTMRGRNMEIQHSYLDEAMQRAKNHMVCYSGWALDP